MFTGIVEEVGTLRRLTNITNGARLTVAAHIVTQDAQLGDSIAVNGVCLTVVEKSADSFSADLSAETCETRGTNDDDKDSYTHAGKAK